MQNGQIRIIGSYLSPYVRKVLVCLGLKGLSYEIDPIVPFFGSDEFSRLSPLRRIPVLIDGDTVLSDSTIICEYLNEQYPQPSLLPGTPVLRGRARWLEEYADSRLGDVLIWHFYNQVVIKKYVWNQKPDEALVQKALTEEIPQALDYLESQLPTEGFLLGDISIADIAIASFFRNAAFARYSVDGSRWPKVKRFLDITLNLDAFMQVRKFEEVCLTTPIAEQRSALRAAGAPISDVTIGTATPRQGFFAV